MWSAQQLPFHMKPSEVLCQGSLWRVHPADTWTQGLALRADACPVRSCDDRAARYRTAMDTKLVNSVSHWERGWLRSHTGSLARSRIRRRRASSWHLLLRLLSGPMRRRMRIQRSRSVESPSAARSTLLALFTRMRCPNPY